MTHVPPSIPLILDRIAEHKANHTPHSPEIIVELEYLLQKLTRI